jgi:opacity protein-like surface antigen
MGVGEARYGRFGFLSDVMYLKVSDDSHVDARLVDADIDLTDETFTGLAAAEYRLIEEEGGSLDALAGARVWWVNAELDFSGAFFNASGSDSDTWVDPIIGLKGRLDFSPEFFLTSWAMIGGFGVSSDFTWDLMGGLGYNASDSISLVAGYRGLSVDYENDGFKFDVVMHGPFLGAVFQF